MTVAERLAVVREKVAEACHRARRDPRGVRIIAVTKYVDLDAARDVLAAGCVDLGESRPQELWRKSAALADADPAPRWHLIGHLQRNKVRRTLEVATLVHTLDSLRLMEAIDGEAARLGRPCDALVELNLVGDPGRSGVDDDGARHLLAAAAAHPHVRIRGLMGMAGVPEGPDPSDQARRQFARLRGLRDRLQEEFPGQDLAELSMGMSGDYVEAILEGSTLVRIGSALFEGMGPGGG
ncbi:MAG: YggS family pyridoxal phosphate-dependent enzyme [Planctomycetia bacterium]